MDPKDITKWHSLHSRANFVFELYRFAYFKIGCAHSDQYIEVCIHLGGWESPKPLGLLYRLTSFREVNE